MLIIILIFAIELFLASELWIYRNLDDNILELNKELISEKKKKRFLRIIEKHRVFEVIVCFLLAFVMFANGFLSFSLLFSKTNPWIFALYVFISLILPFYPLPGFIGKTMLKIWGLKHLKSDDVTEDEIISMVNEGHEQGVIESSEVEMITNIFEFGDKEAKDIMTNRSNICAIDADIELSEALQIMLNGQYSRYPVYEQNLDHIIGILNLKDAVRYQSKNAFLNGKVRNHRKLLRKATFIPETKNIDDLFHSMRNDKTQMSIIIDEYGQTSGLLAMEDILEEIVGNLMDEYDLEADFIEETGEEEYEIEGLTPLEELEDELGIEFECEEYDTLNGFMISKLEHIPLKGEKFEFLYKGYDFSITETDERIIKSVHVKKHIDESKVESEE